MIWPGMGDPTKRNRTIKHLAITAAIAISLSLTIVFVDQWQNSEDPLRVCINGIDRNYKVTATLELYVDRQKIEIPANIGNNERCLHSIHTLTNDGTIYAEWKSEYPFEIGHFFWTWTTYHENGFPIRDMQQGKSKIFVDGVESPKFLNTPIVQGSHYRAEFISVGYEDYKDKDFAPPQ